MIEAAPPAVLVAITHLWRLEVLVRQRDLRLVLNFEEFDGHESVLGNRFPAVDAGPRKHQPLRWNDLAIRAKCAKYLAVGLVHLNSVRAADAQVHGRLHL